MAAVAAAGALIAAAIAAAPAEAVTTGNGALVYSPAAGSSFNPEGGRAAGTTYAKNIVLKYSGSANGTQLVTFDQLVLVNGKQMYPIYRSTDDGATWSHLTDIVPNNDFPTLARTAQPFLYELPQQVGSLPAGTILLSGMIMPTDRSSSRLVVYKSTDHGASWSYLSTIDTGGPATYDPTPTSTTTTVWEPSLIVDGNGKLAAYFSDERQKANGVLQAVSYRESSDGGLTWGAEGNVSAPTNSSDRPGMITVTKLPDGRYLATFEVVNRPSRSNNTAPVYFKISPDGVTWTPTTSIGTQITLANGRGIGSSPYVKWVPTGGPKGMVVVASKWGLDASGNISGGEDFYVNYNLGAGPWERLPMAVTYDSTDSAGGTFSGFAQSIDYSVDGRTLYQATNVENAATTYNDIRVGSIPLDAQQYEAEKAARTSDTSLVTDVNAANGGKVGNINLATSAVTFTVRVPSAGSYTLDVRYDNGTGGYEHPQRLRQRRHGDVDQLSRDRRLGAFRLGAEDGDTERGNEHDRVHQGNLVRGARPAAGVPGEHAARLAVPDREPRQRQVPGDRVGPADGRSARTAVGRHRERLPALEPPSGDREHAAVQRQQRQAPRDPGRADRQQRPGRPVGPDRQRHPELEPDDQRRVLDADQCEQRKGARDRGLLHRRRRRGPAEPVDGSGQPAVAVRAGGDPVAGPGRRRSGGSRDAARRSAGRRGLLEPPRSAGTVSRRADTSG